MSDVSEPYLLQTTEPLVRPSENQWAIIVSLVTIISTLLPYLFAASQSHGRQFMWLGYNLDDSCVYLSWMRQAAAGRYRALNLFTTDPQNGMLLNPFFLILGKIVGMTGLPLLAVYHGARLLFGFLLLLAVWKFICQTISQPATRKTALLFVCFGSGLGWLPFWWSDPAIQTPIDKWQPEAITFLSIYLSPLFAFSLLLQVVTLSRLYEAQQTRNFKPAILAGLSAFVLGLTHTYDVLSLSVVWLTYLVVQTRVQKDSAVKILLWKQGLIAGVIALPALIYIGIQLQSESVFRARANVKTLSPHLIFVLLGYGLLLALGIFAVVSLYKRGELRQRTSDNPDARMTPSAAASLLVVWAVMNVAASYLPVPFQRKMLQGAHFPMACLAAVGFEWLLLSRPPWHKRRVPFLALTVLLLSLTNFRFVSREMGNFADNLVQTKTQRPYLNQGEIEALNWIKAHSTSDDAIQPLPYVGLTTVEGRRKSVMTDATLACFAPGLINRKVYWGHWGETPDYEAKIPALINFANPRSDDAQRRELLRTMQVRYLIFSQKATDDSDADTTAPMFRGRSELPSFLVQVFSNDDADIYEVHL